MLDRLRLRRDPALYAPSYAVLLGVFVSSIVGLQTTQSALVAATAQLVLGVTVFLAGLHTLVYRHEHTELWRDRLGFKSYRPYVFVVIGVTMLLVGLAVATFGYLKL